MGGVVIVGELVEVREYSDALDAYLRAHGIDHPLRKPVYGRLYYDVWSYQVEHARLLIAAWESWPARLARAWQAFRVRYRRALQRRRS